MFWEIKASLNNAPGYDFIIGEVLKQLPRKAEGMLTFWLNSALRIRHVLSARKAVKVIILAKPEKPSYEVQPDFFANGNLKVPCEIDTERVINNRELKPNTKPLTWVQK